ncbi:MAG: tetratricopeptide repeat protein, partial [Desulfobacterales bacterium]|nr:tetratricopeptide repeat protein [Desulfobacterales bacterium]
RINSILSRTRIYTAMKLALDSILKSSLDQARKRYKMTGEVDEILDHTVGPTSYTRNDVLQRQIMAHYQFNLRRMIAIARSVGSEIIFVTPASNLKDMSPFKSENRAELIGAEKKRWSFLYERGKILQKSGEPADALAIFNEALGIDNRYADLHFRVGQVLYAMGRLNEAKAAFLTAKDEDICPLRILRPMCKAVSEIAIENGVPLIDFVSLIENDCFSRYGHKIPGNEYFLDHVHPKIEGNRMLALSLLDQLTKQGILKPASSWGDSAIASVTRKVEQGIDTSKRAMCLRNLGKVLGWAGRLDEAHSLFLQVYDILGDDLDILIRLANSSTRRGKTDEAIEYFRKALQTEPDNAMIHHGMAQALEKRGRYGEAIEHYSEALRINPEFVDAHNNLGIVLADLGKLDEAIAHFSEALRINPEFVDAHNNLGIALANQGKLDEAIAHFSEALRINPEFVDAHNTLGAALTDLGKLDEAIAHFSEALRIKPEFVDAHNNLGIALANQGKLDEAIAHFSEALRINPESAEAHYNLGVAYRSTGLYDLASKETKIAKKLSSSQQWEKIVKGKPVGK